MFFHDGYGGNTNRCREDVCKMLPCYWPLTGEFPVSEVQARSLISCSTTGIRTPNDGMILRISCVESPLSTMPWWRTERIEVQVQAFLTSSIHEVSFLLNLQEEMKMQDLEFLLRNVRWKNMKTFHVCG